MSNGIMPNEKCRKKIKEGGKCRDENAERMNIERKNVEEEKYRYFHFRCFSYRHFLHFSPSTLFHSTFFLSTKLRPTVIVNHPFAALSPDETYVYMSGSSHHNVTHYHPIRFKRVREPRASINVAMNTCICVFKLPIVFSSCLLHFCL